MNSTRKEHILRKLAGKASLLDKAVSGIAGAPMRSLGRLAKRIAVGSPVKGKPWYAKHRTGTGVIDKIEFLKLRKKGVKVWKTKSPEGKTVYLRSKYGPGGVLGWAKRHPAMAGGAVLLGSAALGGGSPRQNVNIYNQQAAQEQPQTGSRFVNWG